MENNAKKLRKSRADKLASRLDGLPAEVRAKVEKARKEKLEYVARVRRSCVGHFVRAYRSAALSSVIKALCLDCMGFDASEVKSCSGYSCPIWAVRPFQGKDADKSSEDAEGNVN